MASTICFIIAALLFLYNILGLGTDVRLEWPLMFLAIGFVLDAWDFRLNRR